MGIFRYRLVVLVIIVVLIGFIAFWFFKPLPTSRLKEKLYDQTYFIAVIKTRSLWDKPFTSIMSSITRDAVAVPHVPSFLRPLIPPTVELFLIGSKDGGGWVASVDLGWRSRPFKLMHGAIMDQVQYRGFGAIEGEYIIRTPDGLSILLYQDGRTLFVSQGEGIIRKILNPQEDKDYVQGSPFLQGASMQSKDKKFVAHISFSNREEDITEGIEMLEKEIGFLLLPSANSISGGDINIRYGGSNTLVADISLLAHEGGDSDGIEGDVSYLLDLLDRFLSTQDMKTDRSTNREDNKIIAQIMIHPGK